MNMKVRDDVKEDVWGAKRKGNSWRETYFLESGGWMGVPNKFQPLDRQAGPTQLIDQTNGFAWINWTYRRRNDWDREKQTAKERQDLLSREGTGENDDRGGEGDFSTSCHAAMERSVQKLRVGAVGAHKQ